MSLTIGSLFSGIGGLELGLERAGLGPVIFQVEKDEYCRAVLAKHWPNATRFEDVKDVGRFNLAPVDVLCGGFPCQDISLAGDGDGIEEGARSGLWREYARIVGELRPSYVVVENVAALLGRGMGRVLGDLASLGYDAEWDCIPASAVGAPHRRDRVFVIAHDGGERGEGIGTWPVRRVAEFSWCENVRRPEDFRNRSDIPEPLVCRAGDGLPNGVDATFALGNAVVPQVAEVVGRVIQELERQRSEAA
jgi:DNA (cytosine-5)-methyltransferase 1